MEIPEPTDDDFVMDLQLVYDTLRMIENLADDSVVGASAVISLALLRRLAHAERRVQQLTAQVEAQGELIRNRRVKQ